MKMLEKGVTAPIGFCAASAAAGIKYEGRDDMALVVSGVPAKVAGTFTQNEVKAAPVIRDIKLVKEQETARAIVLNSGIANACTGDVGKAANEAMAEAIAKVVNVKSDQVLTASTGVIGQHLPVDKVEKGALLLKDALDDTKEAATKAAKAIMTTDTHEKQCAVEFELDGAIVTIGGMAKGSGMIHPNMATMLGVITTDCAISKELLQEAISADVKESFNMISVDRDTSTNDSLMILANSLAGNEEIVEKGEAYKTFCEALGCVTKTLAKMMAADGEGATKLLEATVKNAATKEDAVKLSKSIITSNLVKTAIFGSDANWGRVLCAMGYSGAKFNPEAVKLWIESEAGSEVLFEKGLPVEFSEEKAKEILLQKEVKVIADMNQGEESATAWGCDLSYDYVKINGDYRS